MVEIKKIKCLAVDDEPLALDVIKNYIISMPSLELIATCQNTLETITILPVQHIDLMFIDIDMPQLSGANLMRLLKNPPKVIFTSAYRDSALEGFELGAVDYLLKPVSFERFSKAVSKASGLLNNGAHYTFQAIGKTTPPVNFIYFRADRKILKILLDDILYMESLKDYIKVVTKTKTIISRQTISSLEASLPRHLFIRIHRSFIVALKNIDSFTPVTVEIAKYELPVSRFYRHDIENMLHQS
jgi:DNA-binding LytR/AlgR family response regulator